VNPATTALNLVGKPVGALSHALNRPGAAGRNRPLYPLNLVDALIGGSLEDAVRDRVVLITGASGGIGAVTAERVGAAAPQFPLRLDRKMAEGDAVRQRSVERPAGRSAGR